MRYLASILTIGALYPTVALASTLDVTDSGLRLWLRADNVDTTGSRVDTWNDLSTGSVGDGVAQNATLTDGGPTVINNAVNGRPSVNFGGGGAYEHSGSLGISGQAAFTGFAVAKDEGGGGSVQRILHIGAITAHSGGQSVAFEQESPSLRFNNGNNIFGNDHFTNNKFELGIWRMDTTDTYGSSQFAREGSFATPTGGTNSGNTINLVDEGYAFGKGIATSGGNNDILTAEVSEALVYNRALSQDDVDRVEFYLRHRYSLDFNAVDIPDVDMSGLSGNVSAAPAPNSIAEGAHESNVDSVLFIEQEGVFLSTDVDVNIDAAGTHTNGFDTVASSIAEGTVVNSYYLSFDLADDSGTAYAPTFDIEFDREILGVITGNTQIDGSDAILGASGTIYPTGNVGLENNATDRIVWSGNTLSATLRVGGANLDQIRVLTVGIIPEPATLLIWSLLAGLGVGLRWRRRN